MDDDIGTQYSDGIVYHTFLVSEILFLIIFSTRKACSNVHEENGKRLRANPRILYMFAHLLCSDHTREVEMILGVMCFSAFEIIEFIKLSNFLSAVGGYSIRGIATQLN